MWTAETRSRYAREGLRYPSDVTDAEWDLVRPFLVSSKHKGSPSPERLRAILNGVLYVLSTGCQWRTLPKDLPPRSTVHGWFVRWNCDGVLDRLHFISQPAIWPARTRARRPPLWSGEDVWLARALPAADQGL